MRSLNDAFNVAFNTSIETLEAVLAVQRVHFAEEWPAECRGAGQDEFALRLAEERDGNFFGTQVNRAARLMSAGHGGQVLLSDATYNLVRDKLLHLEPEAKLRYLGEHRLKDLRHNEHIFQFRDQGQEVSSYCLSASHTPIPTHTMPRKPSTVR